LPSPIDVFRLLGELLATGELVHHVGVTLLRVAVSFALAMLIGSAIGLIMGRREWFDKAFDAWMIIALNIPALVTIILCYIWFGLTEVAAVIAVSVNKIPTVVVTVREGARALDRQLDDVAAVYRLSRRDQLLRIHLPQLYPYLMAAARAGLALIWKIVLVVELLGRSDGVGFQLGIYFQLFDITGILAYTFAFAAVILVIEAGILQPLERRITRWRQ
ncbi:MAG: ABC transporter permease, partial [Pseudomonadota bacterium]